MIFIVTELLSDVIMVPSLLISILLTGSFTYSKDALILFTSAMPVAVSLF